MKDSEKSDCYEGEYVNDRKCGKGIHRWASGSIYEGDFFDDFRHGYGEMQWPNGSYYKGQWARGMQDGKGEYVRSVIYLILGKYTPGKSVIQGVFEKNNLIQNFNESSN